MFRNSDDIVIELGEIADNNQRMRAIANNQRASLAVSFVESIDIAAIFTMFLKDFMRDFLEKSGRYVMFPIAAGTSLIQAILAWRQVSLDGGETRSIVHAAVETAAALAIITAVVGSLATTTAFAVASPIIFTATLAVKTFYNVIASICYVIGASLAADQDDKNDYLQRAKEHSVGAIAGLAATAAVAAVFIFQEFGVAGLGMGAGIFGACYAMYKCCDISSPATESRRFAPIHSNEEASPFISEPSPANTLMMAKNLGAATRENLQRLQQKSKSSRVSNESTSDHTQTTADTQLVQSQLIVNDSRSSEYQSLRMST